MEESLKIEAVQKVHVVARYCVKSQGKNSEARPKKGFKEGSGLEKRVGDEEKFFDFFQSEMVAGIFPPEAIHFYYKSMNNSSHLHIKVGKIFGQGKGKVHT